MGKYRRRKLQNICSTGGRTYMLIGNQIPVIPQDYLGAKGHFFVGGSVKGSPDKHYYAGQMYVEVYVPRKVLHPYPLIFFHGAGQNNANWQQTPDGRMGWADYFVSQGYTVYLAEQPARARSAYHPETDGPQIYAPIEKLLRRFTSSKGNWKRARLHTQWPDGEKKEQSPIFQQFARAQVEYLPSNKHSQQLVQAAAGELLKKTGPAILTTHSQAGPFGWNLADAYPDQVKGILAIEPSGPPFSNGVTQEAVPNYGISELPLHFDPPVKPGENFAAWRESSNQELKSGWVMKEPAHKLVRLSGIPILLLVSEASYHAEYDHLTSYFLTQAGVPHDFIRLEDKGIHGNGHMMMLEKNNLEIAELLQQWIIKHIEQEENHHG
ncbi:alpha/beta hydrolase [Acidaminococcus fermentans]|uniref:alpha/beta hydrolase n=1 Tax=Acidaminococcus fermentans TaxID=905 RepID=UPI002E76FA29|nr:alpha/beta hydrolase [Acidaminococcus fermentans]MEE1598266.1 alpha/beta hydrolase [Acidaminococcus fermentans]